MQEVQIERRLTRTHFSKKPPGPALMVTLLMLAACAVISKVYWMDINFSSYLAANKFLVFKGQQYWRLFTTTFVHGDMGHLLSNAYMLGILGFFVYAYFGSIIYPGFTLLLAGLVNALSLITYPPNTYLVGASGLVYLLAGFWLTMYIFIERQRSIPRRIVVASGVALLILFPTSFEENVSYRAHAIGVAVGFTFALVYFFVYKNRLRKAEVWQEIIDDPQVDESEY